MMGYDISWAAFQIIEVMTQTKFYAKRIGYLAAAQSFTETTEVIMLITHLLRKVKETSSHLVLVITSSFLRMLHFVYIRLLFNVTSQICSILCIAL